jgi:predicted MFS family arabinose efflux permease
MKQLQPRLAILATAMLVLSALFLSSRALTHFRQALPPQLTLTVKAVGHSATDVLQKALEYGVPLERMVGAEEFLGTVRKANPGIGYMVVADIHGRLVSQSGYAELSDAPDLIVPAAHSPATDITRTTGAYFTTSIPLIVRDRRAGTLHLGQPIAIVKQRLEAVSYDVITVLVVASLIALELLRFVLTTLIATPAGLIRTFLARACDGDFSTYVPFSRQGGTGQAGSRLNQVVSRINVRYRTLQELAAAAGNGASGQIAASLSAFRFDVHGERQNLDAAVIDHIRWPFFLLVFADSLSLSFFPVFVGQFYSPSMPFSKNVVIGLPISIFMFMWAISMPWAGMLSDRVGHRKAFLLGAAITTVGLLLTASAHSLYELLLWRSLTAIGYGLVFITSQSYISNSTPPAQRTRGMAVFLSSFFAGSLAGSAIGGILADRLGYDVTILFSALLSAAAAIFVMRILPGLRKPAAAGKKLKGKDFKRLLTNRKFVAITFLAAVPAKIALTGFLYYSVPLFLKLLGSDQSTTGRIMMAYGLAIILLSPWVARAADRIGHLAWFVSAGGFSSALAMFIVYQFASTGGLLAGITLLGIAHSIGVSPQLALINNLCTDVVQEVGNGTATGIFRLIERLGNMFGPIISGLLISQFGFDGAFLGIGLLCLVCVSCFSIMFCAPKRHRSVAAS